MSEEITNDLRVFHYTGYEQYRDIRRDAALKARKVVSFSKQRPVIWFTSSERVDPAAAAQMSIAHRGCPIVRIGTLIGQSILPFAVARRAAGLTDDTYRRLVQKAAESDALTSKWYAAVEDELPLANLLEPSIEFYDDARRVWVDTNPTRTVFPKKLSTAELARWAAKLGLFCEEAFLMAALDGYLGPTVMSYAKGYVAGDEAFLGLLPSADHQQIVPLEPANPFTMGFNDRMDHFFDGWMPEEIFRERTVRT